MEKKLKALFDYQRFAGDSQLAELIAGTESRYGKSLSDDDLGTLAAAGVSCAPRKPRNRKPKP